MRSMGGEGVGCRELSSAEAAAAGSVGLHQAGGVGVEGAAHALACKAA